MSKAKASGWRASIRWATPAKIKKPNQDFALNKDFA
jgi:hypothetical protein